MERLYANDLVSYSLLRQWWEGSPVLLRTAIFEDWRLHEREDGIEFVVEHGEVWDVLFSLNNLGYVHGYDDRLWLTKRGLDYLWRRFRDLIERKPSVAALLNGTPAIPSR